MIDKFPGFPKKPVIVVNGIKYDGNPEDVIRDLVKQIKDLQEHRQSYYCVIPWKLLTDKSITSTAKLLYGEISALANREGYCWATNEHLAKTLGIQNPKRISLLISNLRDSNYIYVEIEENYKRKIWLQPPTLIERQGVIEKSKGGYRKPYKGVIENSNIDNNILDNNNENKEIVKKETSIIKKENKYPNLEDVQQLDFEEIAQRYDVPIGFIISKYEDMVIWAESKPDNVKLKGRNWRMTLIGFVKRDALKIRKEASEHVSKRGIDARGVK